MARTKGAKNKPKSPAQEIYLPEEDKLQILADLLVEIVIEEQS